MCAAVGLTTCANGQTLQESPRMLCWPVKKAPIAQIMGGYARPFLLLKQTVVWFVGWFVGLLAVLRGWFRSLVGFYEQAPIKTPLCNSIPHPRDLFFTSTLRNFRSFVLHDLQSPPSSVPSSSCNYGRHHSPRALAEPSTQSLCRANLVITSWKQADAVLARIASFRTRRTREMPNVLEAWPRGHVEQRAHRRRRRGRPVGIPLPIVFAI